MFLFIFSLFLFTFFSIIECRAVVLQPVFERVGIAGLGEGGCAGANVVVAGLFGQKINAPMNKGLFPPKKHTPQ